MTVKKIFTTDKFDNWFKTIRDLNAKARIKVRIERAKNSNFGDCKFIAEGVSEMRIHYGAGYRIYFLERGEEIVILLVGGDKSTQSTDIKTALKLAQELKKV